MSETKPKRRGRPSGIRLKPSVIAKGFGLFCENKSLNTIARELQIAPSTVARYRDSDNWVARRDEAHKKAIKKVDAHAVNHQARQINLARVLQAKGLGRMQSLTDPDIDARTAMQMVKEGVLLERAIMGEGEKVVEVKIKLPIGLEDL